MRILFLFIGEPHHVFHALPIAGKLLQQARELRIKATVAGDGHAAAIARVREAYPGLDIPVIRLAAPFRMAILRNTLLGRSQQRLPR